MFHVTQEGLSEDTLESLKEAADLATILHGPRSAEVQQFTQVSTYIHTHKCSTKKYCLQLHVLEGSIFFAELLLYL